MLATIVHSNPGLVALLVLVGVVCGFASLTTVHAQQPPVHVFSGEVFIDSSPPPDGTIITAWIGGRVVAKDRLKGGKYTLGRIR